MRVEKNQLLKKVRLYECSWLGGRIFTVDSIEDIIDSGSGLPRPGLHQAAEGLERESNLEIIRKWLHLSETNFLGGNAGTSTAHGASLTSSDAFEVEVNLESPSGTSKYATPGCDNSSFDMLYAAASFAGTRSINHIISLVGMLLIIIVCKRCSIERR